MKAEFEISDAQAQLWEAFAEALRDFLKARSRPDIGGPAGTAGLPERLAMRERDLASDLKSLRQRKAIIETFYAGLTEDQRRAADQLAPARGGPAGAPLPPSAPEPARRRIELEAGKLSFFAGGTDGSNPVPSSGESTANLPHAASTALSQP
jgi:hypothetical protein